MHSGIQSGGPSGVGQEGPALRIACLVGQFPAINHKYILLEIRHLRRLGIDVQVASISDPDRPPERLSTEEREEVSTAFYVKSMSTLRALGAHAATLVRRPIAYARGLLYAVSLAGGHPRIVLFYLFYFAEAIILGWWMEKNRLSHVHIHFSSTVGLIARRVFPMTMSFGIYGYGELYDPVGSHLRKKIEASLFVRSISKHARSQLMLCSHPADWKKLEYIPLGIDPEAFRVRSFRENPSPFEIMCVGRLAPEKGQRVLIAALAQLGQRGRRGNLPKVHFVGDGPDRWGLEREVAERGLADCFVFEGFVDQARLMSLYQQTDAMVLASFFEGIPIVLMEAMSMQIPCVAPRITGIPELIDDGVSGLLFAPADADELAQSISRLMDCPALRCSLGEAGRQRVIRDYDIAANTRRFASVVQSRINPGVGCGSAF